MKNINQLKKEIIDKAIKKFGYKKEYTLNDWNKEVDFVIDKTLQEVREEIKKFRGDEFTDWEIWEDIKKELLKKFKGENNN